MIRWETGAMKPGILVVEDDVEVRELLERGLGTEYEICTAEDGFSGLSEAMVGDPKIDLVITDLQMPGITGIELIENLPNDIPVIVISGYLQDSEFLKEVKRIHPVATFQKPFQLVELRKSVDEALQV
jgi:DNA-binding NtrC family response regulator